MPPARSPWSLSIRAVAVVALLGGATATASAGSPTWTPVSGQILGAPVDAVADGPRTLVASLDRRRLIVSTLAGGRVARRQVVFTAPYRGRFGLPRIVALPGGRALAVSDAGVSSLRPNAVARFGPVQRFVPWTAGTARGFAVATAPGGQVLVAWWGGPSGGRLGIYGARLLPDGRWAAAVEISAGTYPALPAGPAPQVAIAAAGAPGGGFGVVWRQPDGPVTAFAPPTTIAAATISAEGTLSSPVVLGSGQVVSIDLTAAAPATGEVIGAWSEGRASNPDGTLARTCDVVATATSGAVARRELTCSEPASSVKLRLVSTRAGGVLAVRRSSPNSQPFRSSIGVFARTAGTGEWSPERLLVAEARGFSELEGVAPLAGAGAIATIQLGIGLGPQRGGRVRVAQIGDDGTPGMRTAGPIGTPIRTSQSFRLFPLAERPGAALLWPTGGFPFAYRASLLTLGTRPTPR